MQSLGKLNVPTSFIISVPGREERETGIKNIFGKIKLPKSEEGNISKYRKHRRS